MKKLILLTLAAICCISIITSKLHALDMTVGASTWYAWWEQEAPGQTTKFDPTFFYGPVLAVKISDDFNLTFVYLYGVFNYKEGSGSNKVTIKSKRSDVDFALNYKLSNYFKAFAGVKYMPYKLEGEEKGSKNTITKAEHSAIGPGLGLSATIPIANNIFGLATLSGFYLWSGEDNDYKDLGDSSKNGKTKRDYVRYGFNSTLALAYYIAPASTVVSLGGRLQYYRSDYNTEKGYFANNTFYGITLTVTYNFSI